MSVTTVSSLMQESSRNFIIDGDFTRFPEGNITAIATSKYGAALWENFDVGGELVLDVDQLSDTPTVAQSGNSSTYSMSLDVTTAETAVAAGDYQVIEYKVTGSDFAKLDQQQVTLSFWHKHTKTGTFCGYFMNSASNRSYVYEYTQNSSNTWERHTETVTLDASGTWLLTEAAIGLRVGFCAYGGSTFQGTAGTWEGAKDYCTSNQVAGFDNAANFCKFSQVGLYLGSTAPTFTGELIATVQQQVDYYVTVLNRALGYADAGTVTEFKLHGTFPTPMRATPTMSAPSFAVVDMTNNAAGPTAITDPPIANKYGLTSGNFITVGSGAAASRPYQIIGLLADARH